MCTVGGAPGPGLANTSVAYYAMREPLCPFKCLLTGGAARQLLMATQLPEDICHLACDFFCLISTQTNTTHTHHNLILTQRKDNVAYTAIKAITEWSAFLY